MWSRRILQRKCTDIVNSGSFPQQFVCRSCGASSDPHPFTELVHYVSTTALWYVPSTTALWYVPSLRNAIHPAGKLCLPHCIMVCSFTAGTLCRPPPLHYGTFLHCITHLIFLHFLLQCSMRSTCLRNASINIYYVLLYFLIITVKLSCYHQKVRPFISMPLCVRFRWITQNWNY